LITAGLFVRSLQAARAIDPGVDVERLASAPLTINLLRYTSTQGREFYKQVVERVERLPGVESATVARVALLGGTGRVLSIHVEGRQASHDQVSSESSTIVSGDARVINANVVGLRYFSTLGAPLLNGRDFATSDSPSAPLVVILMPRRPRCTFPAPTRSARASALTARQVHGARSWGSSATRSTARSRKKECRWRTCRSHRITRPG
jgi:hypothetical protein